MEGKGPMSTLFGGGQSAAAKKSARLQEIANDRQLAQLNQNEQDNDLTRKRPRGRRLFSDAADAGSTGPGGIPVSKTLS
jgi:hypothetical protein